MDKQAKFGIGLLAFAGAVLFWLLATAEEDDVDDDVNADLQRRYEKGFFPI